MHFNETNLVKREIPSEMDVSRLIAEIKRRPALWDVRSGDHKTRYYVPGMWSDVAQNVGTDVTVEECKRKWKNLRDAYHAEVRRAERRIERDKLMGIYNPQNIYGSKWVYFKPMSFINDIKRPRYNTDFELVNSYSKDDNSDETIYDDTQFHSEYNIKLEPDHHIAYDGSKYEIHTLEDAEDDAANDMLFAEFQNLATPQAARRLSASISHANTMDHNLQHNHQQLNRPMDTQSKPTQSSDCKCSSKQQDDQVHFLEGLEREEEQLIMSTRKDIKRNDKLDHVGDSDYNFLVSFLPQMKKMTEIENLRFRSKMCEMALDILAPPTSTNPSPVPILATLLNSSTTTPSITYQQQEPESSSSDYNKESESRNDTDKTASSEI